MFAAFVPAGVVTRTLRPVPAAWAPVVTLSVVPVLVPSVAAVPPMVTPVAPVKFVPVITTTVPPAVLPLVGEMLVMVGSAT